MTLLTNVSWSIVYSRVLNRLKSKTHDSFEANLDISAEYLDVMYTRKLHPIVGLCRLFK